MYAAHPTQGTTRQQIVNMRVAPLVNLAHLDALSEIVQLEGQPALLTHVYAEGPSYGWVDAPGEGIACVDDVARAVIVYLNNYLQTGDRHSLERARAGLNFVLRMQADDGEFYNFVFDRRGTINSSHATSAKSLGWWAYRGLWALARGYTVFKVLDRAYAARLQAAYLKTEALIGGRLRRVGQMTRMCGFRVPAWLPDDTAASAAIAVLALATYHAVTPNPQTARTLIALADGLQRYQLGGPGVYPWGLHPHVLAEPGMWHAWGAHQAQALAYAGRVLRCRAYVESARRELDLFCAWQLVNERVQGMDPLPLIRSQQAYGTNCLVQAAINVYRATGIAKYARFAGLFAGWFHGNNIARMPMYDPTTGRGYDGLESARQINWNAGAESTIEALMALQAISSAPEAAPYMWYTVITQQSWMMVLADHGRPAAGRPWMCRSAGPGAGVSHQVCELRADAVIELAFDVAVADQYLLYVAHQRRRGAPGDDPQRVALGVQLDRRTPWVLPEAVSPDHDYLWLDLLTPLPIHLDAGQHTLRLNYAGRDPSQSAVVAGALIQPAVANKQLQSPNGRELRLRFVMLPGTLELEELDQYNDRKFS